MIKILHLSHTDIEKDSRILKEMSGIYERCDAVDMMGIGVSGAWKDAKSSENLEVLNISSVVLLSKKMVFVPRVVRHFFNIIELTLKMTFKAIKYKPNIIHCHDTTVLPLGALVKFFSKSKLIYDAHELESDKNGITPILKAMTIFTERRLWCFVDRLIVVSPSINKWYGLNVGCKDTTVVLNSPVFDINKVTVKKDYLRKKFSIPQESRIFLYIGMLGAGRGIDLMTQVFSDTNLKSSLVFLGYGDGNWDDKLKKIAYEHPNIFVHDAVPHRQVVSVASSADVGMCLIQNISLSDYYCLPNKLFEYCFSGVPVLASNFPDISDVVNEYQLGKCCELDIESIGNAVRKMEIMDKLPEIDVQALHELSWEQQEIKLTNMYKKLMGSL